MIGAMKALALILLVVGLAVIVMAASGGAPWRDGDVGAEWARMALFSGCGLAGLGVLAAIVGFRKRG